MRTRFGPVLARLDDRTVPSGVPTSWSPRGAGGGAHFSPRVAGDRPPAADRLGLLPRLPLGQRRAVLGGAFWDGAAVYLGTNDGGLRSSDGGQSFAGIPVGGIPAGRAIRSFAGGKANGVTRFAAVTDAAGGIYSGVQGYANDGGTAVYTLDVGAANWVARTLPDGAWPFFAGMARTDATTLYAAGGSSAGTPTVFKSSNGGASWAAGRWPPGPG